MIGYRICRRNGHYSIFMLLFLVYSTNFHQAQQNGNFILNTINVYIIVSSYDVVFWFIWQIAILSFLQCPF